MPIASANTGTVSLSRTADLPATRTYTLAGWFKSLAGAQVEVTIGEGTVDPADRYITRIASGYDANLVYDGHEYDSDPGELLGEYGAHAEADTWWYYAIIRDEDTIYLYRSLRGSVGMSLISWIWYPSAPPWPFDCIPTVWDILLPARTVFGQIRVWSAVLTPGELALERDATLAVRVADLYSDTPFSTIIDTADVSGHGHSWTRVGSIITYNPLPTGETTITSVPVTIVRDVTAESEYQQTVWYVYRPPAGMPAFTVFAWADPALTTYEPRVSVFLEGIYDAAYLNLASTRHPVTVPMLAGVTAYHIKVANTQATLPTNAILILKVEGAPNESLPAGSLVINDDTQGFPLTMLHPAEGRVIKVIQPFPYGEFADILDNGISLWKAEDREYVSLYDERMRLIESVKVFPGYWAGGDWYVDGDNAGYPRISSDHQHTFYLLNTSMWDGSVTVKTLSDTGVIGPDSWVLPGTAVHCGFAPSLDGAVLYYTLYTNKVYRYDLVAGVDLGLFITIPATPTSDIAAYYDLITLSDGTLMVTTWHSPAPYGGDLYHYATDGTLLHSYDLDGVVPGGVLNLNRIARDLTADTIWIWRHHWDALGQRLGRSRFDQMRVSDGVFLQTFTIADWKAGIGPLATDASPQMWGPSYSCPMLVLPEGVQITPPRPCYQSFRGE